MATERELYEDWKPLLEGQQDALVTYDADQEAEKLMVEQTNHGPGVSAGGPGGHPFPLWKKPRRLFEDAEGFLDSFDE